MSSPVQIDHDRQADYAPWESGEERDEDTRRIQAEIVATAERLSAQRSSVQPGRRPRRDDSFADASSPPVAQQLELEDAIREAWISSRLEPVRMPAPPKPGGPTWSMFSRLTGAAGFAAIVALFVTGVIPFPSITISVSRDDNVARTAELPRPGPEARTQMAALSASTATPPQPAASRPPAPPPSTVGVAFSAPANPEIELLLKRGRDLFAGGDINGGRLLLMRAAEAGDARASYVLANSYDAALMGYLGIAGIAPDPVKARVWYMKAAEQGSQDASRRLERMALH